MDTDLAEIFGLNRRSGNSLVNPRVQNLSRGLGQSNSLFNDELSFLRRGNVLPGRQSPLSGIDALAALRGRVGGSNSLYGA
jgi:hypothetical protein